MRKKELVLACYRDLILTLSCRKLDIRKNSKGKIRILSLYLTLEKLKVIAGNHIKYTLNLLGPARTSPIFLFFDLKRDFVGLKKENSLLP